MRTQKGSLFVTALLVGAFALPFARARAADDTAALAGQKIRDMSAARGVERFEQCAVAVREQGTSPDKVLPQVQVVGNGFISLMAYQAKGYAYIAP